MENIANLYVWLAVLSTQVGYAVGWWLAAECGVAAVVIVGV